MLITAWLIHSIPYTSEIWIFKYNTECLHCLAQNFLAMSNKQEMTIRICFSIAFEVKCRYNSFTCSCGSHDQIAKMFMDISLNIKFFKNFLLIIFGSHEVKGREIKQWCFPIRTKCFLKSFFVNIWIKLFKCRITPVCFKRVPYIFNNMWQLKLRGFEIPFFTVF